MEPQNGGSVPSGPTDWEPLQDITGIDLRNPDSVDDILDYLWRGEADVGTNIMADLDAYLNTMLGIQGGIAERITKAAGAHVRKINRMAGKLSARLDVHIGNASVISSDDQARIADAESSAPPLEDSNPPQLAMAPPDSTVPPDDFPVSIPPGEEPTPLPEPTPAPVPGGGVCNSLTLNGTPYYPPGAADDCQTIYPGQTITTVRQCGTVNFRQITPSAIYAIEPGSSLTGTVIQPWSALVKYNSRHIEPGYNYFGTSRSFPSGAPNLNESRCIALNYVKDVGRVDQNWLGVWGEDAEVYLRNNYVPRLRAADLRNSYPTWESMANDAYPVRDDVALISDDLGNAPDFT